MSNLDREQRKIVRLIKAEGRNISNRKVRRLYLNAAVQTGLVESGLRNLHYGDADSQGWRQERSSIYKDPTNLRHSIRRFRQEFQQQYDPGEHSYEVAAQVQRPREDLRGRYAQEAGKARKILGQVSGGGPSGTPGSGPAYRTVPGVDNAAARQQLQLQYLQTSHDPNALLMLAQGLKGARDTPSRRVQVSGGSPGNQHRNQNGFQGSVKVSPTADRPGVHTNHAVMDFLEEVSKLANRHITLGTGTNHSQMTVNGNQSQHWTGDAGDVPARGRRLIRLGQAALIAAGMPRKKAMKQTGGLFNVNGYQIIFNTHEGGDHTNHLHVGV